MVRSAYAGVCLTVVLACGCGTAVNVSRLPDGMVAYGGVDWDLEKATEKHDAAMKNPPRKNFESIDGNQSALLLCDVPFTFVGDTLTLPLVWLTTRQREEKLSREMINTRNGSYYLEHPPQYFAPTKDQ